MNLLLPIAFLVALVSLGTMFGFVRAFFALLMFGVLAVFGTRQVRSMTTIPPDPETADVRDLGLRYTCSMCGLRLKVEVAARDKAPTHCMEPMVLERADGRPPLRPLDG